MKNVLTIPAACHPEEWQALVNGRWEPTSIPLQMRNELGYLVRPTGAYFKGDVLMYPEEIQIDNKTIDHVGPELQRVLNESYRGFEWIMGRIRELARVNNMMRNYK